MTALFWTLVSLCGLAGAHASPSHTEIHQEASRWTYSTPKKCHFKCDGDEFGARSLTELPAEYQCWGTFKMWCGVPSTDGNSTEELSGSACQGRYKSVVFTPTAKPDTTISFVSCEGGHAWINRRTSTCPHTGKRYKKMMGTMGSGTSVSGMSYPSAPSARAAGVPAAMIRPDASFAASVAPLLDQLKDDPQMASVRHELRRVLEHRSASSRGQGQGTFSLESHEQGLSVHWKATKVVAPDSAARKSDQQGAEDLWDSMEGDAKCVLGSSWFDWFPHRPHAPPASSGDHEPPAMTCNGKPAWFHGAAPCWGNFTVAGSNTRSCGTQSAVHPHKHSAASVKTSHHARRALRALNAEGSHSGMITTTVSSSHTETQGVVRPRTAADDQPWTNTMHAECDGLWGGLVPFCWGVSTSHTQLLHGPEVWMAKRTICSGRQGVRFIHKDYAWGMSVSCKGQSLTGLMATIPRPETEKKKMIHASKVKHS